MREKKVIQNHSTLKPQKKYDIYYHVNLTYPKIKVPLAVPPFRAYYIEKAAMKYY